MAEYWCIEKCGWVTFRAAVEAGAEVPEQRATLQRQETPERRDTLERRETPEGQETPEREPAPALT